MFETLDAAKPDVILALMALYRDDPRPQKVDLGIGVYKDESGATPVMTAIKEAERRLLTAQDSKSYLGLSGDEGFNAAMIGLVFGEKADSSRIAAVQTAGGSGALRTLAELLNAARPGATVRLPKPTWPNHANLIGAAGLKIAEYPYLFADRDAVDFDSLIAALKSIPSGDIVLLHGCCHNPSGAELSLEQWGQIADVLEARGLFPFIDLAYQGFGDGLEEDAAGLRLLASRLPELAVAASCSKNFGLYRDRVGVAFVLARDAESALITKGRLGSVTRSLYSMPPDHGAASVRIILSDATLTAQWKTELNAMRSRMLRLRKGFAEALRRASNSDRYDAIAHQRGMFSRLPMTPDQVKRLREEFGIYVVGDGRFNVAGLPEERLEDVAKAVVACSQ